MNPAMNMQIHSSGHLPRRAGSVGHSCAECPTRRRCLAAELDPECLAVLGGYVTTGGPLQRGAELYRAGQPAADCFVVRSGVFKTFVVTRDGQEHVTGFHYPGEILGLSGQDQGTFRDSAVALETSSACRVPLTDLETLLRLPAAVTILTSLLRLFGQAEKRRLAEHTNLSRKGADQRIAGFLLGLGARLQSLGRDPRHLPMPMSRTDLANHLGMTLECLSRVLARFARSGLVEARRTCITLRDPDGLRDLASHVEP